MDFGRAFDEQDKKTGASFVAYQHKRAKFYGTSLKPLSVTSLENTSYADFSTMVLLLQSIERCPP